MIRSRICDSVAVLDLAKILPRKTIMMRRTDGQAARGYRSGSRLSQVPSSLPVARIHPQFTSETREFRICGKDLEELPWSSHLF